MSKTLPRASRFLPAILFLVLPLQEAFCAAQGVVNYGLEWGSTLQSYTYVFSGIVTCQNKPCANARVELSLVSASQGVISQNTQASADGHYQIQVTMQAAPDNESSWKLEAHLSSQASQQSAEAEGRLILMEGQTSVVIERLLSLIQA